MLQVNETIMSVNEEYSDANSEDHKIWGDKKAHLKKLDTNQAIHQMIYRRSVKHAMAKKKWY